MNIEFKLIQRFILIMLVYIHLYIRIWLIVFSNHARNISMLCKSLFRTRKIKITFFNSGLILIKQKLKYFYKFETPFEIGNNCPKEKHVRLSFKPHIDIGNTVLLEQIHYFSKCCMVFKIVLLIWSVIYWLIMSRKEFIQQWKLTDLCHIFNFCNISKF